MILRVWFGMICLVFGMKQLVRVLVRSSFLFRISSAMSIIPVIILFSK